MSLLVNTRGFCLQIDSNMAPAPAAVRIMKGPAAEQLLQTGLWDLLHTWFW